MPTAAHVEVQDVPLTLLAEHHRRELEEDSGIHPDVIVERGYRSVSGDGMPSQFPDYQRRDGLLVPIHSVWGTVGGLQVKPDKPRLRHGKPVKYETVPGKTLCLDVPKRALRYLGDPTVPLWITEGAKKVDAAVSQGVACIVGLQGVYGWRGTNDVGGKTALPDWEAIALNGRDAVIAFDSDCMTKPQVRSALERLAGFLTSRGATVGYCIMPDLPDGTKCGLDDFFVQGKSYDDLCDCIVESLPPMERQEQEVEIPDLVRISDVASEEIHWLWDGWVPSRMLTILGGYGGDGKSTVMASLIAAWTTGGRLPDGTLAPKTNVLMLSAEDDIGYAIRPRLEVHGADIGRVLMLKGTRNAAGTSRWLDLRRDVAMMERVIQEHEIGLVVIDPLSSYLPKADRNSEGDIRDALQPLLDLMERTSVAVVGIMHVGKSADGRRASQRLLGSTAFTALARSVVMVADLPDEQQPDDVDEQGKLKVMQVVKSNYAIAPPPRLFRRPLNAAIRWMSESTMSIDDCFAGATIKREKASPDREDAKAMIREMLTNGPVAATEIMEHARSVGFSEITIRRAKQALGVQALKSGFQGAWMWHLPVNLTPSQR